MFEVYNSAANLPEIWDEIVGENLFLRKEILKKLEEVNPCSQLYHLNPQEKIALVSYKLKLNLLTFTKYFSLSIPTNIIGLPMSVSKSGFAIQGQNNEDNLSQYINSLQGFYLVLNADQELKQAKGHTLPNCKLKIRWVSFDQYLASMRSHYRYRLKKAVKKFSGVQVDELADNSFFNEDMYQLYLNVYQRSNEKLEKLDISFFQNFPAKILTFTLEGKAVAFVQLVENDRNLFFLFGGFEHSLNQKHDLYINMLLQIVDYGLQRGVKQIDFGQTTEETKLKLGALQEPKYLYVHHSNPIINALLSKLVGKFSYRRYEVIHEVFRKSEVDRD